MTDTGGILITGAIGKIGAAVSRIIPHAQLLVLPKEIPLRRDVMHVDLAADVPDFSGFDTVIHLACQQGTDLETAAYNSKITFNVLRACTQASVKRLIWASSLFAEGEHYRLGGRAHYYGGSKLSEENLLAAYCEENPHRIAVAMRFGHFDPHSVPPLAHQMVRLDEAMLTYWMNNAIALETPGLSIWCAIGRASIPYRVP